VTELIQPLAAVDAPREQAHAAGKHPSHVPSFSELIYAHFEWAQQLRQSGGAADHVASVYPEVLRRFEGERGRIVHAYWCSEKESAVALTESPRRHRFQRRRFGFHRESDWATKDHPSVTTELQRCDALAVRAQEVLTGVRQRICLQLVTASAAHLLSLVDATTANPVAVEEALAHEREGLDRVETYYRQAANGQAQITYFAGMATVAAVVSVVAALVLTDGWVSGVAALLAGSLGAVVSVVQRINAGDFELEYDVGRPYAFFLGGLRPLIGGALAVAISYAFVGGLLHLPVSSSDPTTDQRLALVVISFFSGFSERWAQDTLAATMPTLGQAKRPAAPPAPPQPGAGDVPPGAPGQT
jgi:hypothetical protein